MSFQICKHTIVIPLSNRYDKAFFHMYLLYHTPPIYSRQGIVETLAGT